MKITIKAPPRGHIIQSIINTEISYPEALGELIDNSIDADATRVVISGGASGVTISDNGKGCPDLAAMVGLGNHKRTSSTKIGRYGVGGKNAAIGLGEVLLIDSTNTGVRRTCEVFWAEFAEDRDWQVEGDEAQTDGPSGTTLTIGSVRKNPRWHIIRPRIGFTFAPAIERGIEIEIDGELVRGWVIPLTSPEIDEELEHPTGEYGFRVRAGRCQSSHEHQPFVLSYEHRILGGTSDPCGEYTPTSRFLAFVELYGSWDLLKHKDGLTAGVKSQWLYEQLQELCSDLLRDEQSASESVETAEIEAELADAFGCEVGTAARPNRHGHGKREAKGTARKVETAETVHPSSDEVEQRESTARRRGFSLSFDEVPGDVIGRCDVNRKRIAVKLNTLHPVIQEARTNRAAIALCALWLVSVNQALAKDKNDGTGLMKFYCDGIEANINNGIARLSKGWLLATKGAAS